jgi:hypothetical protein
LAIQLIDSPTARILRMIEQRDPAVARARQLMQEGRNQRQVALELGWYPAMVCRLGQLDDPKSDLNRRLKGVREDRERRRLDKQRRMEQARVAREVRGNLADMRRASASEPVQYEQFLARERGEPEPGLRIPLLDYSEEDERETDQHRKRAWRGEFRRISRKKLTVEDRVDILVGLARSDDPTVAMKALHELHSIEGAIKKPTPEVKSGGGPLFSIPGGLPIQVAPVAAVDLPVQGEDDRQH